MLYLQYTCNASCLPLTKWHLPHVTWHCLHVGWGRPGWLLARQKDLEHVDCASWEDLRENKSVHKLAGNIYSRLPNIHNCQVWRKPILFYVPTITYVVLAMLPHILQSRRMLEQRWRRNHWDQMIDNIWNKSSPSLMDNLFRWWYLSLFPPRHLWT